jgi:hypothetical protein
MKIQWQVTSVANFSRRRRKWIVLRNCLPFYACCRISIVRGDIVLYPGFYAPEMTSYYNGKISGSDESQEFIRSPFAAGGRTLEFTTGDRTNVVFSESKDAANLSYPWREKFQYGDGSVSEIQCNQTEVWHLRSGQWKIVHIHLTAVREHTN